MARASKNPAHRTLAGFVLSHFAARGPLFADARFAVCRAAAFATVVRLAEHARSEEVAFQAAATLGVHARKRAPARFSANRKEWAEARRLLTLAEEAAREVPFARLKLSLQRLLFERSPHRGLTESVYNLGLAVQLAHTLAGPDEALQLRCARTILSWTRALWLQSGYKARSTPAALDSPPRCGRDVCKTEGTCRDAETRSGLRPPPPHRGGETNENPHRGGAPP